MTVHIRERGMTRVCSGLFSLNAAEELVKRFPKKYRFIFRSESNTVLEVL